MIPTTELANGVSIPVLGFGTYKLTENVEAVVASAIEVGFRHIDTAQMYGNEQEVGVAWKSSGLDREEFFLTSKLDNPNHGAADALRSFEESLRLLQTEYLDLFLIHWPLPDQHPDGYRETWGVLEELYIQGKVRAIGLSNFYANHLSSVLETAQVTPHVNQIESHPYLPQNGLHDLDSQWNIRTEAWSPLARGKVTTDPLLIEIGDEYGKSAAQVAIKWGLQRGDILFPKATTAARQLQNIDVFDFDLSEEAIHRISSLDDGEAGRVGSHPEKRM